MSIQNRKREHLQIVMHKNTSSCSNPGFEDIILLPKSLPELDLSDIDISTNFLGKNLSAPLIISSMTGGSIESSMINQSLAKAAQKFGLAISVGSQKAMIKHPELSRTYEIKEYAPDVLLLGNIGIDYLISDDFSLADLKIALKKIKADGLFVHINTVQELVQPEGLKEYNGAFEKIKKVINNLDLPVLIKEIGAGLDLVSAEKLAKLRIKGFDVAGVGGTSWPMVESYRGSKTGETFANWGLPTCLSLLTIKKKIKLPLISSGGIRTGLDVAKSIAMGAELAGIAKPFAVAAMKGEKILFEAIDQIITELRTAMLLAGTKNITELKRNKFLIKGDTRAMLKQLI